MDLKVIREKSRNYKSFSNVHVDRPCHSQLPLLSLTTSRASKQLYLSLHLFLIIPHGEYSLLHPFSNFYTFFSIETERDLLFIHDNSLLITIQRHLFRILTQ